MSTLRGKCFTVFFEFFLNEIPFLSKNVSFETFDRVELSYKIEKYRCRRSLTRIIYEHFLSIVDPF